MPAVTARKTLWVCAALLGAATGCGEKKGDPAGAGRAASAGPAEARPTNAQAAAGSGAGRGQANPVPPLDEARARQVIDAWQKAQNDQDFAAYQKLYAERMVGIKRVGDRKFEYVRKGWLDDRGRMFKKPMRVGVESLSVVATPQSAVATFVQTFEQGTFKDSGQKQIVMSVQGPDLVIAREEMVESRVDRGVAAPGEILHFVLHEGEKTYVLVSNEDVDSIGSPASAGATTPAHIVVARPDESKLDPASLSWNGATVSLHTADGDPCVAKVKDLVVLAGVTPHFSDEQYWRGAEGNAPLDAAQVAAEVWKLAGEYGRYLVGEVENVPDACADALWATRGTAPVVRWTISQDQTARAAVIAAFRKLDDYREAQKEFGGTGPWEETATPNTFNVNVFASPDGKSEWATVYARAGEGCGSFEAMLSTVFEKTPTGWKLRSSDGGQDIQGAFDIDGDGAPELIGKYVLVDVSPRSDDVETEKLEFPFYDCGC